MEKSIYRYMDNREYMVEQFERDIINDYIQVDRFGVYIDEGGYLYLSDMYVKEMYRGQGVGSEVMGRLCEFADTNKLDIRCIPSSDDGSGDERLILFYKRYGFEVSMNHGCGVVSMERKVRNS